ncbi:MULTISPECIES: GNAT family N-acetyltransferase [unclassified Yoonia]|uniref:GNAT family N-acetyltransferase n=1 Tax=unclassified Yoonia TaxID=2629118 RepID=UPI002AFFBE2F|nr:MULTISPECIES: GNAT family N-acetyltransferase [unclassified Yoonia]
MPTIPTLTTARLRLRAMTFDDWSAYCALMTSERAHHVGGPFSVSTSWGMFCADHAQWDMFGCGALMVDDRVTGLCAGQVAINAGLLFPEHEIGWMVYPDQEGRGIAFEAATALRDWAASVRGLKTLVSYVDPANVRSRRLAERMGATLDDTASRPDPDDLVYRHFG